MIHSNLNDFLILIPCCAVLLLVVGAAAFFVFFAWITGNRTSPLNRDRS